MFTSFKVFVNNIKTEEVNDYFNCYSSFIMSKKDMRDNVLNHRMNFLINYYVEQKEKVDKIKLLDYYMLNMKDKYDTDTTNLERHIFKDDSEKRDDDVELHYKNMFAIKLTRPEVVEEELVDPDIKSESSYEDDEDYYDDYDEYAD